MAQRRSVACKVRSDDNVIIMYTVFSLKKVHRFHSET